MFSNTLQKRFDLEERCLRFAKNVRDFCSHLPLSLRDSSDVDQVRRASGSVGANYIEANESLGKADLRMRIRIARKEAKECRFWLELLSAQAQDPFQEECAKLIRESHEIELILGAILRKITVS